MTRSVMTAAMGVLLSLAGCSSPPAPSARKRQSPTRPPSAVAAPEPKPVAAPAPAPKPVAASAPAPKPVVAPAPAPKTAPEPEAAPAAPPAPSLVANGDFQTDADHDGTPDGWPGPSADIVWKSEGGNRYMHLEMTEPGKMVMVYRLIQIPAGVRALELSFRERHFGIKVGKQSWFDGRIMMNFKDGVGKGVSPGSPHPAWRGTQAEWQARSVQFLVPKGARTLEFMPSLFQAVAGSLEFDDFRLTPVGGADLAGMAEAAKKKSDEAASIERDLAAAPTTLELKVKGNGLVSSDGKPVWLQGLSVDSMQWGGGENILRSVRVALSDWKANCIRLAVTDERWFGRAKDQGAGAAEGYRTLVDKVAKLVAGRGSYLVLDLHGFGAPKATTVEFWKDAGARYKNNPAVLFELFNEPHGISWKIWRDGGSLSGADNKVADVNPQENDQKSAGDICVGMQAVIDAVRATGARNMVICGGLDWAYDLSGVMNGFELDDRRGNGVMYVSHIYPWKTDWQGKVLAAAKRHPVIITEVGCPPDWSGFQFIPKSARIPLAGWSEDVLAMIQQHKLNWTGFSFHPTCGPNVVSDWDYTPTPYWGVYVKDALAGKQFVLKKMR